MTSRLSQRFGEYARRTSPVLLVRFLVATVLLGPVWIPILIISIAKTYRWRQVAAGRGFLRHHSLAFPDIDPTSLRVTPISGGISNCSLLWRCVDRTGAPREYFVKVFLSVGTLWAWVCPWVSPFPRVHGSRVQERLAVDIAARARLAEHGVAVAQLVAFDPVQSVVVTEHLHGTMVSALLDRVERDGVLTDDDRHILRACGATLAKVHQAGVSVVDTQPANCMWLKDRQQIAMLDLEYCTREDKRMWDVGFFLAYLTAQLSGAPGREAKHLLLDGYMQHHGVDTQALSHMGELLREYLPVFQAILDMRHFTPDELFGELIKMASPS